MKIISILGARPNFMKISSIIRAIDYQTILTINSLSLREIG